MNTNKIDENEAPDGYFALDSNKSCEGCAFYLKPECLRVKCAPDDRKDGQSVIFKKREVITEAELSEKLNAMVEKAEITKPPIKNVLMFKDRRWVRTDGSDPSFDELMETAVVLTDDAHDRQEWRYSHDEIEAACGGEMALRVRDAVMKRRERIVATLKEGES